MTTGPADKDINFTVTDHRSIGERLTILPPPCFFMCLIAALVHKKVPLRLNWMTLSQSSNVRSSTLASLFGMMVLPPTAFTRRSAGH